MTAANWSNGQTVTVREALDAAARRIDSDLADQPRLHITLMRTMGQAYNGLGLWQEASLGDALITTGKNAEARAVLTESLALRRKVLPAGHRAIPDGEARLAKI